MWTKEHILITGGATRIGLEISRYFHSKGSTITVHHLKSPCPAFADSCIQADLTVPDECKQLIERANKEHGQITTLIHNAALFAKEPWKPLMDLNLKAPYYLSDLFKDQLGNQKGNIIFMIDTFAERGFSHYATYASSKTGCIGTVKYLARAWAPNIRVNAISPGLIVFPGDNPPAIEIPLGIGSPTAICEAIRFLIENAYVTGTCLRVDGGRNLK